MTEGKFPEASETSPGNAGEYAVSGGRKATGTDAAAPRDVPARSAWKRAERARLPSTPFRIPARCDRRTGRSPRRSPPDRATSRRAARGEGQDAPGYPRRPSTSRPAAPGGPVAVQSRAFPGPRAVPARSAWRRAGRARLPSSSFRIPARCDRRTGRGPSKVGRICPHPPREQSNGWLARGGHARPILASLDRAPAWEFRLQPVPLPRWTDQPGVSPSCNRARVASSIFWTRCRAR